MRITTGEGNMRRFVCNELIDVLLKVNELIEENIKQSAKESIKSQYIYTYALFESAITEALRVFLMGFPLKINKNKAVSKELILSSPISGDILLEIINSDIREYSSKSLRDYLEYFYRTLSISIETDMRVIEKISELRNIIVHDSFKHVSNLNYTTRPISYDLDIENLKEKELYLKELQLKFVDAIKEKYSKYTLEKACRDLWSEIFTTHLLDFDKVWSIDNGVIHMRIYEDMRKQYAGLSRSEKLLFSLIVQQYNGGINDNMFKFEDLPAIYSLDTSTRKKLIELLQVFIEQPYLFNGKKLY